MSAVFPAPSTSPPSQRTPLHRRSPHRSVVGLWHDIQALRMGTVQMSCMGWACGGRGSQVADAGMVFTLEFRIGWTRGRWTRNMCIRRMKMKNEAMRGREKSNEREDVPRYGRVARHAGPIFCCRGLVPRRQASSLVLAFPRRGLREGIECQSRAYDGRGEM
jgi:hypothetical protein